MNNRRNVEQLIEALQGYLDGNQIKEYTKQGGLIGLFDIFMDEKSGGQRVFTSMSDYKVLKPKALRPWKYEEIPTGAVVTIGNLEAVIVRKFPAHGRAKHPTVRLGGYGNTSVSTITLMNQYRLVNRLCSNDVELKDCGVWEEQP